MMVRRPPSLTLPHNMGEGEGGGPRPARGARGTGSAVCGSACPTSLQTGTGAKKKGASPQQYGAGPRGEPAGRRLGAAADQRLQQKRSWIMRAWVIFGRRLYVSFKHGAIKPAALVPIMG